MTAKKTPPPPQFRGSGRPNKLLIQDFATGGTISFQVETTIHRNSTNATLFDELVRLINKASPTPSDRARMKVIAHGEVDRFGTRPAEAAAAKAMFSSALDT